MALADLVTQYAQKHNIPADIAMRQVQAESSGNPHAVSSAGAQGLLQLMPATAKGLGVTNPFDPNQNLDAGFRYLSGLYKQYGDWGKALAAYNWGPGNIDGWMKDGAKADAVPSETRNYVARILNRPFGPSSPEHRRGLLSMVDRKSDHGAMQKTDARDPYGFTSASKDSTTHAPASNPSDPYGFATHAPVNPMDTVNGGGPTDSVKVGGHTVMQHLGGLTQAGAIFGTGAEESKLSGNGYFGPEFQKAAKTYVTNPGEAADRYGFNAKPADDFFLKHAPKDSTEYKQAEWEEKHPKLTGLLTFGEQMLTPENALVGKVAEPATKPAFEALTDALSPFRGIAKAAGHSAAAAVRAMASRMQAPVGEVEEQVEKIFGGLTQEEKRDVLRRSEPLGKGQVADSKHDLDARAKQYLQFKKMVDAAQKDAHPNLLPEERTFNIDKFHPLAGQFKDPAYNDEMNGILDELRTYQGGGGMNVRKGTASMGGPHKTLSRTGINDALKSGLLKDDYDPAVATRQWATRRLQNAAFEKSIQELPKTLRRDISARDWVDNQGRPLGNVFARSAKERPFDTIQNFIDENHQRFGAQHPGRYELRPADGMVPADQVLSSIGSPTLNESLVHPELAKFLKSKGGSVLSGQHTGNSDWTFNVPGWVVGKKDATVKLPVGQALDHYNSAMRSAIIANPVFHPVWNLRENMAAAGKMPVAAVRQTLKTIVGAVSQKGYDWMDNVDSKLFHQANQKSEEYAQQVHEAIKDGATAEMHPTRSVLNQDIAKVRTMPYKGASPFDRIDKFMTSARDWNSRSTFGPNGEQAFATSLYHRLKKMYPNATGPEIGNMVRDSLGAYQNVDPNNPMSRVFFFYPWLKGNTLNWMRNMLTRPGYTTAPLEGIRRNNQMSGDPNFSNGQFSTKDYSIFSGMHNGQANYMTPPLPQRVAADVVNSVGAGDPSEIAYTAQNVVRGHANPIAGNILDLFSTNAKAPNSPALPSNYDTIFDRHAPKQEQWKQVSAYFAGHDIPIPLVQFSVQDAARRGVGPDGLVRELQQAAGVGYPSNRLSSQQAMVAKRLRTQYEREYQAAQKSGNDGLLIRAYSNYMNHLRRIGVVQ